MDKLMLATYTKEEENTALSLCNCLLLLVDGCAYKGMLYAQDETWEDGCEFDCRCIDGTVGIYQCTAK
jgi:hypothetical protein